MSKVMDTYEKYREPLLYVIVGALTTAVNFVVYFICADVMNISVLVSEGIGWVCSVSFAYITDKIVVFNSIYISESFACGYLRNKILGLYPRIF